MLTPRTQKTLHKQIPITLKPKSTRRFQPQFIPPLCKLTSLLFLRKESLFKCSNVVEPIIPNQDPNMNL